MAFKESNNLEDFVGKIDWEGGVTSALEYGLESDDYEIPDDVAEKWDEIRDVFGDLDNLIGEFYALVKNHGVDF